MRGDHWRSAVGVQISSATVRTWPPLPDPLPDFPGDIQFSSPPPPSPREKGPDSDEGAEQDVRHSPGPALHRGLCRASPPAEEVAVQARVTRAGRGLLRGCAHTLGPSFPASRALFCGVGVGGGNYGPSPAAAKDSAVRVITPSNCPLSSLLTAEWGQRCI